MIDYLPIAERKNLPKDYKRAKRLRQEGAAVERFLWNGLRTTAKEYGLKFRRQHPISPYIVDFVCLQSRLIIEIDGPSHDARVEFDRVRSNYLQQQGYPILRFSNDEVHANCEGVILHILHKAEELKS